MDKTRIATWNDTLATPLPPGNTSTILLCATFSLIGTFGIVGNALVISIIERLPTNNRAASLHLIFSQAVNDLVASFLIIPVTLCGLFSVPPPQNSAIVGNVYCRFIYSYSILFITFSLSTYNLTILAYERYMAVVKPMVYKAKFTKAHSKKCVYISWILAPLSQMVLVTFQFDYDRHKGTCINDNPSFGPLFQSIVGTMIFVWEYLIP
ncbi:trace amine-associated receptor 7e-like, partial [Anneissia japonica]|uniref:trace amine-associated receptor 7e-like n=1 Tax=Anneissia japonica TaxID=1529436 RepID=UPI001425A174